MIVEILGVWAAAMSVGVETVAPAASPSVRPPVAPWSRTGSPAERYGFVHLGRSIVSVGKRSILPASTDRTNLARPCGEGRRPLWTTLAVEPLYWRRGDRRVALLRRRH